jgi:two-component system NtrC family sensor kinase
VELLREWFGSQGTLPHGSCYQWNPTLIWLHVVSDILVALAYFSIPVHSHIPHNTRWDS